MPDDYTQASIDKLLESCSLNEQDKEEQPLEELDRRGIRPLFNKTEPQYRNQHEQYHHRLIAFLKAEGNTNVEIARLLGMSSVTINYLVKQPYMEELILEEIHKHGDEALAIFNKEAMASALELVKLRNEAKNEEVRRKSANDILDRKYGKPNQPMTMRQVDPSEVTDEELLKAVGKN